ncbi:hypothetical protein WR25_14627 isoform B [Diploscapter pachys]|uniref:E3 UFM1-protein ligase 1 homolog n=1 Tax=Diploscapter pachys TaxID=2018661 RepID=A0A2A2LF16_9BILA|nr:hypothetical protein WR25_14627 isoform B [Diploscapter pachys]
MTTWKDIQKLASDLQRIQLAQSVNKLSEQNCVEVISKLFNRKAINVVFTRDGHSYVTTKHLMTEVQNECLGNGGRCSLTEAATALNVDFDHVDAAAKRLVAEDDSYKLFNGELFSQEFAQRLHQELLVLLNEHGFQTVQQLAKHWNISQELLNSMLLDKVDSNLIVLDESTFYNKDYLESRKNVLRGILAAISKPMSIASIQKRVGLTTKRFWIAYDELQNEGEVSGRLSASRTSTACSYIPHYYDALIHQCLKNIYRQSNYIQVSLLRKLGIAEDKKEVEKMLEQKNIQQLPTLFIADSFYKEIVNGINEDLKNNGGLCDVRQYVQANELPIEDADIDEIGEKIAQEHKNIHSANGYLFNTDYLQKIVKLLEEKIELKAKLELDRIQSEKKQPQKSAKPEKDDDWNEGGGKKKKGGAKGKGSGAKQQQQPGRDRDEREESPIQTEEWLREVKEVPEDILDTVAEEIKPAVSRIYVIFENLIRINSIESRYLSLDFSFISLLKHVFIKSIEVFELSTRKYTRAIKKKIHFTYLFF